MKTQNEIGKTPELVSKEAILIQLFPNPADRPTCRWLDTQVRNGKIPVTRVGRLVWFNVAKVRRAFGL
jgi:hypothetical protein